MFTAKEEEQIPTDVAATQIKERARATKLSESAAPSGSGNRQTTTKTLKFLDILAATLLVVGGFNWGFIGLFQVDFVAIVFGEANALSRMLYTCVGASAVYAVVQVVSLTAVKRRWQEITGPAHPTVTK